MTTSTTTQPVDVLDRQALRGLMDRCGTSTRQLAADVRALAAEDRISVGCSSTLIGHLLTGHTLSTDPRRARLIERVLNAPPGALFVFPLTHAPRTTGRNSR